VLAAAGKSVTPRPTISRPTATATETAAEETAAEKPKKGAPTRVHRGIRDRRAACSRLRNDAAQRVGGSTGDDE